VRSAIKNSGFDMPPTRITINLAPADLKKEGSGFDLPIAVGILGAYGALQIKDISDFLLVGELGLDGSLRAVPGVLPIAVAALEKGSKPDTAGRQCSRGCSGGWCERLSCEVPGGVRELLNAAAFGTLNVTPLKVPPKSY